MRSAVVGTALPYGYTVTIFSSGQAVTHAHGVPSVPEVLLFSTGAAAAYGFLRWGVRGVSGVARQLGESPRLVRAGALQLAAILAAILAAALLARLPEVPAWPAAAFAATLAYLGIVSVELALLEGVPPAG
jgi:hypothetical protein